jgi:hypothetical protein
MARDLFSPIGILDETHGAVTRTAAPWLGVLWLCTIPYRLAQAYFIHEVIDLGGRAPQYAGHLESLALVVFALLLLAVFGRAVYVRACLLALQSGARPGREAWRVPAAHLVNSITGALFCEVLFAMSAWTFLAVPLLAPPTGLVYPAAVRTHRPGLGVLVEVGRLMGGLKAMTGLVATFAVAVPAAFINFYMALRLGLWVASALGGDSVARWEHLLRPIHPWFGFLPGEPLTALICVAGTLLIIEPFWLASLTVYAHRTSLRQSGEDLRLRFRMLTGAR